VGLSDLAVFVVEHKAHGGFQAPVEFGGPDFLVAATDYVGMIGAPPSIVLKFRRSG